MSAVPFIRLRCAVQPYPYGKKGSKSLAARYAAATPENNFHINEEQPYGEIWMGDHSNGCARTLIDGKLLSEVIAANPEEYLGPVVYKRFKGDKHLPYLFKTLSFDKALPLQAHPDRLLAEQLMKQEKNKTGKNETFVDPNHKPEVAVALSDVFEGFVGFRPINEIQTFIIHVPELREALNDGPIVQSFLKSTTVEEQEPLLKQLFSNLLLRDQETIGKLAEKLVRRLEKEGNMALGPTGSNQNLSAIVKKTFEMYPGDVGLFAAAFFMNLCRLSRGQGIAVPANCIHAYLEGDAVECMAWLDNMIACGFENIEDRNDPQLFLNMLQYNASSFRTLELEHQRWSKSSTGRTELYQIPLDEFDLLRTQLGLGEEDVIREGVNGPTVFIVTRGKVQLASMDPPTSDILQEGAVVLVKAGAGFSMKALEGDVELWGSFVE